MLKISKKCNESKSKHVRQHDPGKPYVAILSAMFRIVPIDVSEPASRPILVSQVETKPILQSLHKSYVMKQASPPGQLHAFPGWFTVQTAPDEPPVAPSQQSLTVPGPTPLLGAF